LCQTITNKVMVKTTVGSSYPYASITRGKNRLKIYNDNVVYMQDGEEFEIELFNPTQSVVGAAISINGQLLPGGMIIVKPGRREYLCRHIDRDAKFVFSTYEIDKNDAAAAAAIAKNGIVRVEFFLEQRQPPVYLYASNSTAGLSFPYTGGAARTTTNFCASGTHTFTSAPLSSGTTTSMFCNFNDIMPSSVTTVTQDSLETGRVEPGAASGQSFGSYYGDFESTAFAVSEYHIKPESVRPVEVNELRSYCPNCRARIRKSSWKFCPGCGESLA